MKRIMFFLVSLLVIGFAVGCYYDKADLLYPQINSACDTTNVTFAAKVTPILNSYCISCHGTSVASAYGGGIKLEAYTDVKVNLARVYGAINQLSGYSAMPKGGGKLSDCKIKIIKIWQDKGALNN